MSIRIRRAAAAVAVSAASLVGTVALATPAWAADTVQVNSFGNLILGGGAEANSIRFFPGPNGTVRVTDFASTVVAGTNCVQESADTVRCSGAKHINANGRDGDDVLNNDTGLTSVLGGGRGNDVLDGGSNADQLDGSVGFDSAFGQGGVDSCRAEQEQGCETD